VYEVRRAIGAPGRVQTCNNGYVFHVNQDDYLDLQSFRELHAEGEQAIERSDLRVGAAKLEEALSVWREPALADSPPFAVSYGTAKALLEERALTQQLLIDAMLALGHHRDAVVVLYQLTASDPLRERWWELLMMALYRCGDQAAALEAFGQARSMLAEKCGIDPGPGLQTLQQRILAADPGLAQWSLDTVTSV
jgi:DNA-binding SARP family transcriptional activator